MQVGEWADGGVGRWLEVAVTEHRGHVPPPYPWQKNFAEPTGAAIEQKHCGLELINCFVMKLHVNNGIAFPKRVGK